MAKLQEELQDFCDRVECIDKAWNAPLPPKPLSEEEVAYVVYLLAKDRIAELQKMAKIRKGLGKSLSKIVPDL